MKAIRRMLAVAVMVVPALALSQDDKAGKPSAVPVQTSLEVSPKAAAQPEEKPGLDVSRMPFDPESIRQVVRYHMPEIQECYEKVLADSGERIEGRVMAGFTIDLNGNVTELKALPKKSTVKDERVVDCVLLKVRCFAFPKPADNRVYPIEYPFDLKVKSTK